MSDKPPEPSSRRPRPRRASHAESIAAETTTVALGPERIAKVMARAGLCSRRDAEVWIKGGRVAVNGTVLTSPALNVGPDDRISVDGQPLVARERTRLFLYHKPRGLVTTARDPEGRPTVFDSLPDGLPRVVSIGRLDINTEGLLLLTNDGGLARVLELPATGWLRRYRVRANGFVTQDKLADLKDGIVIDGVEYAGIEAALDRTQGANQWLTLGLREGKNREIKRVLEHIGLAVNRLIRVSFGPFQLGELAEGMVEEVRPRVLKDQLGAALAAEAGVVWDDAIQAAIVTQEVAHHRVRPDGMSPKAPPRSRPARTTADHHRPDRGGPARKAAEPPRAERPAPRSRPHVSALRGDAASRPEGPRKRISRQTTEDRTGRTVKVERVTVDSKERHSGERGGTSRNARNFAREHHQVDAGEAKRPPKRGATRTAAVPRERAGGFSSERPLTGRALKDGKVRRAPKQTGGSAGGARPRGGTPSKRPPGSGRPPRNRG